MQFLLISGQRTIEHGGIETNELIMTLLSHMTHHDSVRLIMTHMIQYDSYDSREVIELGPSSSLPGRLSLVLSGKARLYGTASCALPRAPSLSACPSDCLARPSRAAFAHSLAASGLLKDGLS